MSWGITNKINNAYKEKGIWGVLRAAVERVLRFLFETNNAIWFKRDLLAHEIHVQSDIPLTISYTHFDETLSWIRQLHVPWMLNEDELRVAINQCHCWANIKYDDKLIGYIKLGFNDVFIVDYNKIVTFPKRVAFIYDTYVLPELRGHKVASFFINELAQYVKNKGYTSLMCHIPPWNIASIKSFERIGFKRMGKIRSVKVLGVQFLTANPIDFAVQ